MRGQEVRRVPSTHFCFSPLRCPVRHFFRPGWLFVSHNCACATSISAAIYYTLLKCIGIGTTHTTSFWSSFLVAHLRLRPRLASSCATSIQTQFVLLGACLQCATSHAVAHSLPSLLHHIITLGCAGPSRPNSQASSMPRSLRSSRASKLPDLFVDTPFTVTVSAVAPYHLHTICRVRIHNCSYLWSRIVTNCNAPSRGHALSRYGFVRFSTPLTVPTASRLVYSTLYSSNHVCINRIRRNRRASSCLGSSRIVAL